MARKLLSTDACLAQLTATPVRIAELTAGVPSDELLTRPGADAWSANEVLAHLRACADARGECIPRIVAEDHPTLRAVNPLSWIKQTDYLELGFEPSLRAFARQRRSLVALLDSLPAEGWSRSATVTGAGAPIERSVHVYADWVADHERVHLKQIEKIVHALRGNDC